jgi:hypothetical protein
VKITEETTIGELKLLVGKLGVSAIRIVAEGFRRQALVLHPTCGAHEHTADNEAAALQGAFESLVHAIAGDLPIGVPVNGRVKL